MNAPIEPSPPLTPEDPRLSEWIDGRLTAAEAALVERAVSDSPALARLVADLRALKEAARRIAAASPPAGFADRVMAALAADRAAHGGAASDASDQLVEAEWRAIEAERIAEERAEASADLEEDIGPVHADKRPRWPWLTIATALAAGLLLTVVLNYPRPDPGPVEVALATAREAEPMARKRTMQNEALRKAAEAETAAAPAAAAAVAPRELARAAEQRGSRDKTDALAEPIEVMVRGPEGRAKLLARLASLGLAAMPTGAEVLELVGPEEAVAAFLADPLGEPPSPGGPKGTPGELAQATPAPTADVPQAALARGRSESLGASAAAPPADAESDGAAPARRILIRVSQLPAIAGEPSEP